MRGFLFVADVVHIAPDGTLSILRGGVGGLSAPAAPAIMDVSVVMRISSDGEQPGRRVVGLGIVDKDGTPLPSPTDLKNPFHTPVDFAPPTPVQLVVRLRFPFERSGQYQLVLTVDDIELDRWPMTIDITQGPV